MSVIGLEAPLDLLALGCATLGTLCFVLKDRLARPRFPKDAGARREHPGSRAEKTRARN